MEFLVARRLGNARSVGKRTPWRMTNVPRTQRSAISAFTRVFDALRHLRSGALQSRGRIKRRCVVRSRFCEAARRALHRARDTISVVIAGLDPAIHPLRKTL